MSMLLVSNNVTGEYIAGLVNTILLVSVDITGTYKCWLVVMLLVKISLC